MNAEVKRRKEYEEEEEEEERFVIRRMKCRSLIGDDDGWMLVGRKSIFWSLL